MGSGAAAWGCVAGVHGQDFPSALSPSRHCPEAGGQTGPMAPRRQRVRARRLGNPLRPCWKRAPSLSRFSRPDVQQPHGLGRVPAGPLRTPAVSRQRHFPGVGRRVSGQVRLHLREYPGATVCLEFTPDFDLQKYQDRLVQAFLSLPEYAGVQMAISKVLKAQTFLGVALRSSTPVIQIVLIDDRTGLQTGTAAEQMAADIMSDIAQHGEALGISNGKMEVATGSIFSAQTGISTSRKILTGTVLSLLFSLLLLGGMLFLYKRGTLRLRAVRLPRLWGGAQGLASPEPASSKGFDNPMFDVPTDTAEPPGAAFFEDTRPETALKDNQVFYLNPLYNESEVDT